MHSIAHRANTVLTFFGSVAAVLAILTTCTDLFYQSNPSIKLEIAEIKKLIPLSGGKEQVKR